MRRGPDWTARWLLTDTYRGAMSESHRGVGYGLAAYLLWGTFPLYFRLLQRAGAVEIVLHRIVWSLVVCALLMTLTRRWREMAAVLRDPRRMLVPGGAAFLLALNWGVYIYGVNSGQVVEASLGYFINPLFTVALGVVVLGERLRRLQWAAVIVGLVAVLVLTVDYGRPPYIALVLAASFGTYGLAKNRVGLGLGAVAGLTVETMVLAPVALVGMAVMAATGTATATGEGAGHLMLLVSTGVATVVPLLAFAAAARRVPLSTVGLLQYLTPVLQLLVGVVFLGESLSPSRLFGFAIVWLALAILTADSIRHAHRGRRTAAAASAAAGAPAR